MKAHIDQVFKRNIALAEHTTFRIGGPARYFCRAASPDDVRQAVLAANAAGIRWAIIGGGSNILAGDDPLDAAVIAFKNDSPPRTDDTGNVIVSGGSPLAGFVAFCAARGFAGPEALVGIPGTVGGAIAGNAGAYGTTVSCGLIRACVLKRDGSTVSLGSDELRFDYRTSSLRETGDIVLSATYRLATGCRDDIETRLKSYAAERSRKHPDYVRYPTAGSFFKNLPPPIGNERRLAAGRLLEEAGAKDLRCGDAAPWPHHANIVVNYGRASARDVLTLADRMAGLVQTRFGISLEREVVHLA